MRLPAQLWEDSMFRCCMKQNLIKTKIYPPLRLPGLPRRSLLAKPGQSKITNYAKRTQFFKKSNVYNLNKNKELQQKMDNGHLVKTNPNEPNFTRLRRAGGFTPSGAEQQLLQEQICGLFRFTVNLQKASYSVTALSGDASGGSAICGGSVSEGILYLASNQAPRSISLHLWEQKGKNLLSSDDFCEAVLMVFLQVGHLCAIAALYLSEVKN